MEDAWDQFEAALIRFDRRITSLEGRLDEAERTARNALDDVRRLEDRVRDLEYVR
jgi:hypothetical protein